MTHQNPKIHSQKDINSLADSKHNIEGVHVFFDRKTILIHKKQHSYEQSRKFVYKKSEKTTQSNAKQGSSEDYLCIDRETQQIKSIECKSTQEWDKMTSSMSKKIFSAFLGIVDIQGFKFVVLCDEAKYATNVDNILIFEVASLYFLGYLSDRQMGQRTQRKEVFKQIRELYEILKTGFYFSYKYNLTQSFQYQDLGIKNRFTWNMRFFKQLENHQVDKKWFMPIIQGFVSSFNVFIEGTKVSYILLSRRSNKKAGTRYFDRGTDEDGYVANFVHTEQIIKIDDFYISDPQIRGSVPIFFEQKGLRTLIKLTRGYELTHDIYKRHMKKLKDKYQRVFFVNLLCEGKRGEKIIIEELQKHIKQESPKDVNVKYMYYDFHKAVHGTNIAILDTGSYSSVDVAIQKVKSMKLNLGYYIYDSSEEKTIEKPEGIFRTNCLDCLDRTNFFQAKLALISLENILNSFNIKVKNLVESMNNGENENDLIVKFRHIWADNGDMISFHYTGTGSTHTDITRDGKRGFAGNFKHKYKTVTRFYNQNFWDFYKMNMVDLLLGQNVSEFENVRLPTMVRERQDQFCQKRLIDVYIFSWKVPKKVPKSLPLFPTDPNLIVISLQEISQSDKWNKIIKQSLDSEYILIGEKFSNNNLLKIYVQSKSKSSISNVELTKVKFKSYFNQYVSTKCAIVIRFLYNQTKFTFCGCQLEYGREFSSNRVQNLKELHEYAFQEVKVGEKKSQKILLDDVIFLFGNMNTHVSPEYQGEIAKMKTRQSSMTVQDRRQVSKIVNTDEFWLNIRESLMEFREYEEEEILFPPTYRYVGHSKSFDPEKSGWPDRIWYSTSNKIICSSYSCLEELREEHVPVTGRYSVEAEKVDYDLKARIVEQVIAKFSTKEFLEELEASQNLSSSNTEVVEQEDTPLRQSQMIKR